MTTQPTASSRDWIRRYHSNIAQLEAFVRAGCGRSKRKRAIYTDKGASRALAPKGRG